MATGLENEAALATLSAGEVRERQATMWNFDRFYLLEQDDLYMLEEEEELYKYLQSRAKALAFMEEANQQELESEAKRTLGELYLNEAREILTGAQASNDNPDPATMNRAAELNDLAASLLTQADSLQRVADRLRSKASLNNVLADELLADMDADKTSRVLEFEARVLRGEPHEAELIVDNTTDEDLPVIAPGTTFNDPEQAKAARDAIANGGEAVDAESLSTEDLPDPVEEVTTSVEESVEPVDENVGAVEETVSNVETSDPIVEEDPLDVAIAVMPGQAEETETVEEPASTSAATATPTNTAGMLLADVFYLNDEPVKNRTIPMNVGMPKGVVFKIQVGAFSKRIPSDLYGDLDPVTGEQIGNGLVRYSAGLFMTYDNAADAKKLVRDRGYQDAFVVAYIDGKRVSIAAAKEQLGIDRPELVSAPVVATKTKTETRPTQTTVPVSPQTTTTTQTEPTDIPEFDMAELTTDYGNDPNAAPADKVETIKGLFFTVQVGVYSKPVALDKLYNITPLNTELIRNDMIRYTTGRYSNVAAASGRKEETRTAGVADAFVTAYMNGKRIGLAEAKALLDQHGTAILAQ